jgi:hypothetical protein
MPNIDGKHYTLWKAAARFRDLVYIAATNDEFTKKEIPHSVFLSVDGGQWQSPGHTQWATAGVCVVKQPSERFVAVSEDGDVFTYVGGNATAEAISPTPSALAATAAIDGYAYACGMRRQVYLRTGEGQWQSISAPAPKRGVTAGFEAISGYSQQDIYAVGWEGEIWQRSGGNWLQHDSPVNLILTGVCCAEDGYVYACGQSGTLVKGRNDQWAVIEHEFTDDFWDIHAFGDRVYVASYSGLFEIKNGSVKPVDFGAEAPRTCHRLTSAEGILWSVGAEDIYSFDGSAWQKVVPS